MREQDERHPFVNLLADLAVDQAVEDVVRRRVTTKAKLFVDVGISVPTVAKVLGCSTRTLYRRFAELAAQDGDVAAELAATSAALAAGDQLDAEARDQR